MYGIEAAVILFACVFSVIALWTAPWWIRALARLATRFDRQLDRAGAAIEKFLGMSSQESSDILHLPSSMVDDDSIPEEEK